MNTRSVLRTGLGVSIALGVVACGSSTPRKSSQTPAQSTAVAASPHSEPQPSAAIHRSAVRRVLRAGPGAFLQRISVEDRPVLADGKFRGFRVAALHGAGWDSVDLRAGDVLLRVNGLPIERPEEALEAFRSLEVASELRVDYERNGAARALRYAIVDD